MSEVADTLVEQVSPVASAPTEGAPPDTLPAARRGRLARHALEVTLLASLLAGAYAGYAWSQTGSFHLIWPYLLGHRLFVTPMQLELGEQPAASVIGRSVNVLNLTGTNVTLLGAQTACSCVTLDKLPLVIPSGKTAQLNFEVGLPKEIGPFEQRVKYHMDRGHPSHFSVLITATTR